MTVAPGKSAEVASKQSNQSKISLDSNTSNHASSTAVSLPLANLDSYTSTLPEALTNTSTTLAELAHLAKLQSYQEQKRSQSQNRLFRCLISNALSVRLTRTVDTCHSILVDHLKSDHKKDFATLYTALHDVKNSCEATRKFALLEQELEASSNQGSQDMSVEEPVGMTSWLQEIPHQARETILTFISMLRSNPQYLASRLGRLSSAELEGLAKFHQPVSPPDSVIANPRRGAPTANANVRGSSSSLPSPVERLLSFHRNDPLYTMVHSIFANSMGPDSAEDKRRTDVWAAACVKLIMEAKGDQFLFAVLDSWATMRDWPARTNLEMCLMGLLQEGAFLLERAEDQAPGKSQQELRGKTDLLADEFLTRGVRALFKVLDDDPSAGGIPEGVLELGKAILDRIEDPKRRRQVEYFIMVKWFFGRFLISGIQYPEV